MNFEKWGALNSIITFGKHKGETVENILEEEPSYLKWLLDTEIKGLNLEVLRDDIERAVELEKDIDYYAYTNYPDPMWD